MTKMFVTKLFSPATMLIVVVVVVLASFIPNSFCFSQRSEELGSSKNESLLGLSSGVVTPPDANCQIAGINYGCTQDGFCFKSCSISPQQQGEYCYTARSTAQFQTEPRRRCYSHGECSPIWDCAAPCIYFEDKPEYVCASYGCEGNACWAGCDLNPNVDDEWCFTYSPNSSGNSSGVKTCKSNTDCRPNSSFECFGNCEVNS